MSAIHFSLFPECDGKEETTVYSPRHIRKHAPPKINRSPPDGAKPTRRIAMSAYSGSLGERKVYITEEFDSTPGTWPRGLSISYLGKHAPARPAGTPRRGVLHVAHTFRSYYSLLRNRWSRLSTGYPRHSGRFPPTWSAVSAANIFELPAFCSGEDKIITKIMQKALGIYFSVFSLSFRYQSYVNNAAFINSSFAVLTEIRQFVGINERITCISLAIRYISCVYKILFIYIC